MAVTPSSNGSLSFRSYFQTHQGTLLQRSYRTQTSIRYSLRRHTDVLDPESVLVLAGYHILGSALRTRSSLLSYECLQVGPGALASSRGTRSRQTPVRLVRFPEEGPAA